MNFLGGLAPKISQCFFGLGLFFFLLMLTIPTTYQGERGILLGTLVLSSLVYVTRSKWQIHPIVVGWSLFTVTTSLLFMLIGAINSAPGALRVGTVYVVWPVLFIFFMGIVKDPNHFCSFFKTITIGAITVALMAFTLVADQYFGLGIGISSMLEEQGAGLGIYEGTIEYRLFNMTTVIYALPFFLALLLMPQTWSPLKGGWRVSAWAALGLSILTLLISGRRAFWLTAAMSPIIVGLLLKLGGMRTNLVQIGFKGLAIGVIVAFAVIPFFELDLFVIFDDFLRGFDFSDPNNMSSYYRKEQFFALTEGWMEVPLFGAGHGSAAMGSIRSEEQPWAYELSYLALLYQIGIMGVLVYGSAIAWIFYKGIKMMRRVPEAAGFLIPTLSALACFLVANATNPYLQKFDYLWTIFLPVAVLNAYMMRSHH